MTPDPALDTWGVPRTQAPEGPHGTAVGTALPRPQPRAGASAPDPRTPGPPTPPAPPARAGAGSRVRARQPRHRGARERVGVVLAAADAAGVLAGTVVAVPRGAVVGGLVTAGLLVAQHRAGLYRPGFAPAAFAELPGLMGRAALVWGLLAATAAPGAGGWVTPAVAVAVTAAVAAALRAGVYGWRRGAGRRHPASTLVVAPDAASAAHIAAVVHARPEYGLRPVGLAAPAPVRPAPPAYGTTQSGGPERPTPPGTLAAPAQGRPAPPANGAGPGHGMPPGDLAAHLPARPAAPAYAEAPHAGHAHACASRPAGPAPLRPAPSAYGKAPGAGHVPVRSAPPGHGGPSSCGRTPGVAPGRPAHGEARGAPAMPPPLLPVLHSPADVTRAVVQNAVRQALVTGPATLDARTTATVRLLAAQGCVLWHVGSGRADDPPVRGGDAGHLWGHACRRFDPYPPAAGRLARGGKRALDAAVAAAALLCLAPLFAACALVVRLTDGPGVIFRQERIGLHGRPFTLLKFRTLRPADDDESATRWSVAGDHRMSRAGHLLRRTSLDELPQLWNVLRGDMSLVGPRPERPYFVTQFSQTLPGYADRHRMPAGLTGLAQVHGLRGNTSIADRARFDNHYIDSWTLWQDVSILLRTAVTLFRHGGS